MNTTRITELLQPFLSPPIPTDTPKPCHSERSEESRVPREESAALSPAQLQNISTYIDLLLRWNARINLTAIREPEEIVTRHFGESLFAARHLFATSKNAGTEPSTASLIDVGSGAGFPGLAIKIWAPQIHLTLLESNQKKATFLREVARSITLTNINVFPGRAENYPGPPADAVTLRAVEQFDTAMPAATNLVAPKGRLALLIGKSQLTRARDLATSLQWSLPIPIPLSSSRVLEIGAKEP
jgi:16S rRNA (guanine527-N7)-methyltransferase